LDDIADFLKESLLCILRCCIYKPQLTGHNPG